MYIDYKIINDKEILAINEKGESINIKGLNNSDIKKLLLLSNKIEGLEDKINLLKNELDILPNQRKYYIFIELLISTFFTLGLLTISLLISLSNIPTILRIGSLIITTLIITTSIKPFEQITKTIKENKSLEKKYNISLNKNNETIKELKNELSNLMTTIKVEKERNTKKEELINSYRQGLNNNVDFSLDYKEVKKLTLK